MIIKVMILALLFPFAMLFILGVVPYVVNIWYRGYRLAYQMLKNRGNLDQAIRAVQEQDRVAARAKLNKKRKKQEEHNVQEEDSEDQSDDYGPL
ncbi:MAG: hypothetical protein JWO15_3587 [Sphingomonadales bacterium]|nr:hypothetical protein [Sphingomonadales bacterium]